MYLNYIVQPGFKICTLVFLTSNHGVLINKLPLLNSELSVYDDLVILVSVPVLLVILFLLF